MRIAVALCFVFAVASAIPVQDDSSLPVNDLKVIQSIDSKGLWTAGANKRFDGVTRAQAHRLLGVKFPADAVNCPHDVSASPVKDLPSDFDSRTQWPGFIHGVQDQGQCGSCWAFGATETLADRFAIASKGAINFDMSAQDLVSCDTTHDMGCGGGYPTYAADYLVNTGVVALSCEPYVSGDGSVPPCATACANPSDKFTQYKYSNWSYFIGEDALKAELVANGPIAVAFAVYNDFFNYASGVYTADESSGLAGYHAVKLIGYGVASVPAPPVDCDEKHPGKYKCDAGTTCCCDKRFHFLFINKCEHYQCCASADQCKNPAGQGGCTTSKASDKHVATPNPDMQVPYWIVQNSWGASWGDNGTFKILRGKDECGIETGPLDRGCPIAGTPLIQA